MTTESLRAENYQLKEENEKLRLQRENRRLKRDNWRRKRGLTCLVSHGFWAAVVGVLFIALLIFGEILKAKGL